jgi:2-keto-4-pentenoate hydratase/2-oxohepta-3-ene-1,7-dioic acid hydratase in catechol pathway
MKFYQVMVDGSVRFSFLDGETLMLMEELPDGRWQKSDRSMPLLGARLLPPIAPSKVVALGLNYKNHALEMKLPIPEEPIIFLKPATAVIGPGEAIVYPGGGLTHRVDYEAELGIVIAQRCRKVKAEDAAGVIMGYTCVNDVTARDLQGKDGQWTRAKSFDTFCPIGPCIETELDPADIKVRAILNGKVVQESSTAELIFSVPKIVELVTRVMTLLPGDIIATGTPPGVGRMKPGDEITVEVEGIGRLTNPVVEDQP